MKGKYLSKPSLPFPKRNSGTSSLYILLPEVVYACMNMCISKDITIYNFYYINLFFLFYSITYLGIHSLSLYKEVIYSF